MASLKAAIGRGWRAVCDDLRFQWRAWVFVVLCLLASGVAVNQFHLRHYVWACFDAVLACISGWISGMDRRETGISGLVYAERSR